MSSPICFRIYFPSNFSGDSESSTKMKIERKMTEIALRLEKVLISLDTFELLTISNEMSVPVITGHEVAVKAMAAFQTEKDAYLELIKCWNPVTESYSICIRPMLVIAEIEAFEKSRCPQHVGVQCSSLKFGSLPFPGSFVSYTENLVITDRISIDFIHDEKRIEMVHSNDGTLLHDVIVVSYNNISKILVKHEGQNRYMYLVLLHPPLLYQKQQKRARNGFRYELRKRVRELKSLPAELVGRSDALCISVDPWKFDEIISRMHRRCNRLPIMFGYINDSKNLLPQDISDLCFDYFSCRYLFSAILKRNFYVAEQLRTEPASISFKQWCVSSFFTDEEFLEKSLTDIFFAIDAGHFVNFRQALVSLYNHYSMHKNGNNNFFSYILPAKCRKIRRAIMTPTRLLLWPPEIMFENRVLRNFNSDFALRVNFRDDDITRLSFNASFTDDSIFQHAISMPMKRGLRIGGRWYEFLGWSNSQIRDHGVWMYARDDKGKDIRDIRHWMGDFSHIHSVPKYMSRMGQCFSQTEDTISVPLKPNLVRTDDDIEHGCSRDGKPYCFSDGVGRISESLSKKVREALGHDSFCSAFQIRYGGYKGMLVTDPTLKDVDIVFRKSMKKFDSPENTRLEIAKTSAPVPLFLNRPFVTILAEMGVKHNVFLRLQEEMLRTLTDMLIDEKSAAEYLCSKLPFQAFDVKEIACSGIGLTTEPFFRALLLALHRHNVYKIKSRANIAVDLSKGRNMLGVLDETGKLQYGQVFVQYTNTVEFGETRMNTTILKGTVLVTKNPCMHPGDVRKFEAVDVFELHHIVDCIVFPQKGPRPHPNEMAGSDLDGDEYAVVWDDELIFKRPNYSAADFPSYPGLTKLSITEADIIDFLVDYIKNDQVGTIANAHLALADSVGIFSDRCKSIASKFSVAVDFPKTGASSTHFHLERDEKPECYPDFMEKFWKITYRSKKALGKMFRVCKDFETENTHASLKYSSVQPDPDLFVDGWKKFEEDAIKSKDKYYELLNFILQNHGVQHEAEAFSGAFTKLHCRYHERKDKAEVEKVIIASLKSLWANMKKDFYEEFRAKGIFDAKVVTNELLQKASAWYIVAYRSRKPVFLSFPWMVCDLLANIKSRKLTPSIVSIFSPLVDKLNMNIMQNASYSYVSDLPYVAREMFESCHILCQEKILVSTYDFTRLWAIDNNIIQGPYGRARGFMFLKTLINIFLFVAEKEGYIFSKRNFYGEFPSNNRQMAATLFLAFLRYCAKLNFCEKKEAFNVLPFEVYKSKRLGKIAMLTYHYIAITGGYYSEDHRIENNMFEMKPEYIECREFLSLIEDDRNIQKIEESLQSHCQAESVTVKVKKTTKKLIVTAYGTQQSINMLRTILNKGPEVVKGIVSSGMIE